MGGEVNKFIPNPTMFVKDIPTFDGDETRAIMLDNVRWLMGLPG